MTYYNKIRQFVVRYWRPIFVERFFLQYVDFCNKMFIEKIRLTKEKRDSPTGIGTTSKKIVYSPIQIDYTFFQ